MRLLQFLSQGFLHLQRELVLKATAVHIFGADAMLAGTLQNVGILMVREDNHHLGIETAISNGIENRLAIRTRPGTQYGKTETHNAAHST